MALTQCEWNELSFHLSFERIKNNALDNAVSHKCQLIIFDQLLISAAKFFFSRSSKQITSSCHSCFMVILNRLLIFFFFFFLFVFIFCTPTICSAHKHFYKSQRIKQCYVLILQMSRYNKGSNPIEK